MMILDFQKYSIDELILQLQNETEEDDYLNSILNFLSFWKIKEQFKIMSSGTTGAKKELSFSKKSLIRSAQITIDAFSLKEGDLVINALPLTFVAGKMMFVRAIVGKLRVLVVEPSANPIVKLENKISFSAFTPYQLQHIIEESAEKLSLFNKIIIGGSKISDKLDSLIQSTKAEIYETFGMSETLTHIALRPVNGKGKSDYFSVLPAFTISTNEDDCLLINAKHIGNTSIETNDIIRLEGKREFQWVGRKDNVINSGGVKLFPEEIEKKLSKVIDQPFMICKTMDDDLGEKVVLVIESKNDIKLTDINFSHLSKYEIPKELRLLNQLPRNKNGKLIRVLS